MGYNYYKHNSLVVPQGESNQQLHKANSNIKTAGIVDLNNHNGLSTDIVDYQAVNTLFNTYSTGASLTTLNNGLKGITGLSGAKVWGTPQRYDAFESLEAVTASPAGQLTQAGVFDKSLFDNPSTYPIQPSNFPGCTKGCLWYAISIWRNAATFGAPSFIGTIYLNFREYPATGSNSLRELHYPAQSRAVEAFIVYGEYEEQTYPTSEHLPNGYEVTYNDTSARYMLSSEAHPGPNGYVTFSPTYARISQQDGIWGYKTSTPIDGHKWGLGTYSGSTLSFGIQNLNSSDSTVNDIYWGKKYYSNVSTLRVLLWTVTT